MSVVHLHPGTNANRVTGQARAMGLEPSSQKGGTVLALPSEHNPNCMCRYCRARRAEEFDGPEPPTAA